MTKKTPSRLYSVAVRVVLWEDAGKMCHYCDRPLAKPGTKMGKNTHFDHIVPQAKGGSHDLDNLVVCCKYCNREKAAKSYEQFLEEKRAEALKKVRRISRLLMKYRNGQTEVD
jgi:5-methylcytosine-specific restriction endonuclease McrA